MKAEIRVAPRAARQIRAAAKWWVENRSAAPTLLADEIEAAFDLIADIPLAGEAVSHARIAGLRRILLGRTQHYLYYVVSEGRFVVEVIALWHTSRGAKPSL